MKETIQPLIWPAKAKLFLFVLLGLGILTFAIALRLDPTRAWANFLTHYYFCLCISVGGIFFVALQHITGAAWSAPLRRIPETFVAFLPVALILFLILLGGGMHHLYEWTHAHAVESNPLLVAKASYLNVPFFALRNILFLVVSFFCGTWMLKNSLKQDRTGAVSLTKQNTAISAPFILFFAWGFTFVSIDLMKSLSPHWFSTIFGIYCFAILFLSTLATITLMTIALVRRGALAESINENHYHDLGKLLFAFVVFWGYIAFSQFMLIWYANLPEETFYFITRLTGGWKNVSIALMMIKFIIPLFLLISRKAKRNERILFFAAAWLLLAQWLDIYWLVFPTFWKEPMFGWVEIGMFVGFAALFLLVVGRKLMRVAPIPLKDPRLAEGLHHHQ